VLTGYQKKELEEAAAELKIEVNETAARKKKAADDAAAAAL